MGYPHNQWLEILVRYGLLGVPLLLFSIFVFSKTMVRGLFGRYHLSPEWYFMALIFIFAYLQSLTSLRLDVNRVLWLGLGYMCGYAYLHAANVRRSGGAQ